MDLDVRLLTASYKKEDEDVLIELFGKTKSGKSVTILYKKFKPYFHILSPPQELLNLLKRDEEILDISPIELWYKGKTEKGEKVTLKFPWRTPHYREIAKQYCRVLAADIPFHHRFIYDFDIGGCVKVIGKDVTEKYKSQYTTDEVIEAEEFSETDSFNPSLKILSFDIENSIETGTLLMIGISVIDDDQIKNEYIVGGEKEILEKFKNVIKREDPDVITGYNIDGYDIPFIINVAEKYNLDLEIGRNFSIPKQVQSKFWRLNGRIIADAWWNVKKEIHPKQETLNAVAKQLLNEEKIDVDRTQIDDEWRKNKDKVIKYCMKDAELALRILTKIDVLKKNMDLATVSKLPLDDVINGGTSTLIDSILIRIADRKGIGVPLSGGSKSKSKKIEGGYVHTIEGGLYHNVCVLDFKSMYPAIIIKYNICFTTLSENGEIISPIGVRFLKDKEGIIPQILKDLMQKRDEIKKKMKESNESEKYYEGLQNAIKILMNSFYGVFASSFYRFTNPEIGASITAFARETTKLIIRELEEQGISVIYGDTDSVFFSFAYDDLDEIVKNGIELSKKISKEQEIVLEFEKVLEPFFSHGAKKRYVGNVAWPEYDRGKTIVRGYETRRTDSFDLQSDSLKEIFDLILTDRVDKALDRSKEIMEQIKSGDVPIEKLVISRTVKDFSYYKDPNSMVNVQIARKLMDMGEEFISGMKVSWIVTNGQKTPQEAFPYISGKPFDKTPDWVYYADRLSLTLSRVTEVFGLSSDVLLTGIKQTKLF